MNLFEEKDISIVYLAGPMRGYPRNNVPAFRDAAKELRARGLEVVSPVELDEEEGDNAESEALTDADYNRYLRRDIVRLITDDAQALVVLPGWEESRGASLETHVARELGMPVFSFPGGEQVKRPSGYEPPSDETVLESAARAVANNKIERYGHPLDDFHRSALVATAILDGYLKDGREVQDWHIPLLMIGMKISRQVQRPDREHLVDIAGYARTIELMSEEAKRREEAAGKHTKKPKKKKKKKK